MNASMIQPDENKGSQCVIFGFLSKPVYVACRGVPAYTQSTQLRTLIFECPKSKNVLNHEKCNQNMPHPG